MMQLVKNILRKSNSGFTMIELSIVILVMAIFGTLTAEILSNATKIYSESLKRQQFISEARSSFFKISRELSWQKHFEGFKQSSEKKIFINTGDGNSISYEIRNSNDILNFNNQLSTDLLSKKINKSDKRLIDLNVITSVNMFSLAERMNCKKYFCVSTDKATDPINMMGASKLLMEKALFSKDKGLFDLKLILSKGKNFLNENGKVYLEHAPDQYEELNKFAMENGYLNFSNLNDLNGDKRVSIYQC